MAPKTTRASRARKDARNRPNPSDTSSSSASTEEQKLLDLFASTFHSTLTTDTDTLQARIQRVKGALYDRDYAAAFGEKENLEAYVVRWSPSRALAYRWVFAGGLGEVLRGVLGPDGGGRREVVCIGAGAGGEFVGLAGALAELHRDVEAADEDVEGKSEAEKTVVKVTAIDSAEWGPIFEKLDAAMRDPQPLPNIKRPVFSSPSPLDFQATFLHADILSPEFSSTFTISPSTSLITLLFTTNELYTQSMSRASAFLLSLRSKTAPGCLLLVLESAGSYSTIKMKVGGVDKEYPMGSFLDFTMVGRGDKGWEKAFEADSMWYRLPTGLKYPLELENMRFLVRVYRRIENANS